HFADVLDALLFQVAFEEAAVLAGRGAAAGAVEADDQADAGDGDGVGVGVGGEVADAGHHGLAVVVLLLRARRLRAETAPGEQEQAAGFERRASVHGPSPRSRRSRPGPARAGGASGVFPWK